MIGELSQGKQTQFTGPRLCLQVTYPDRHDSFYANSCPNSLEKRASNAAGFSRLIYETYGVSHLNDFDENCPSQQIQCKVYLENKINLKTLSLP